jgi:hypothetical protein
MSHYLSALAQNQVQWLKAFAQDDVRARRPPFHSRDYHFEILRTFQDVVPFITPSEPNEEMHSLETPTLWKSDVRLSGVTLPDETSESVSVINGWKNAHILPYCLQAFPQTEFEYRGDLIQLPEGLAPLTDVETLLNDYKKKLERPILPEEEARFRLEHRLAGRHRAYQGFMSLENRRLDVVLSKHCWNIRYLASEICLSWENSIVPLRQTLFALYDQWDSFTNYPAPTSLVKLVQQREEHSKEYKRHREYSSFVEYIEKRLGSNTDGLLEGENSGYDTAIEELLRNKLVWDENFMGGPFPMQDGQLSWMLTMRP